jgi:hypothetical protein
MYNLEVTCSKNEVGDLMCHLKIVEVGKKDKICHIKLRYYCFGFHKRPQKVLEEHVSE